MGEKDIVEKNLESYGDVFADIVNVLLFGGKRIVKEEELESDNTDSMFKNDGRLHEQARDVSKIWKKKEIRVSIIGFENQTVQDYKMPLRVISYDGASYKKQLLDKKNKSLFPVITLILYFGVKKWTAPQKLTECFNIPEELKPFVSDYKINVFNIAWLDDDTIEKFTSDFKIVAKYFQTKRLKKDYLGSDDIIQHVDETLKMLSVLVGDNSLEKVYDKSQMTEGGVTMCEMIQKIRNEGRKEGRTEGRIEGKEELIIQMLASKKITVEQMADILQLPVEKINEIVQKVPVGTKS